jgi:hypothetical protein
MDKAVLLAQLRSLLDSAPDFGVYSPTSAEHHTWLGKGHALISRWDEFEAISFKSAANLMHLALARDGQVAAVLGIVHRAIADLELDRPRLAGQAFGPGDVYDFFKALSAAVGSATSAILVIDPYVDDQIFDTYLSGIQGGVNVRILTAKYGNLLKPAVQKFTAQHKIVVEVRISADFHDRVLFIDGLSCWVMGQSLKDAAKAKPTYVLPLPTDVASMKLTHYETIWAQASVL